MSLVTKVTSPEEVLPEEGLSTRTNYVFKVSLLFCKVSLVENRLKGGNGLVENSVNDELENILGGRKLFRDKSSLTKGSYCRYFNR